MVPEGSGADGEVRFQKVPVPDGSGTHTQVRMRKVPVQRLGEVLGVADAEGSGAEVIGQVPEGCGTHTQVRMRKVPVQGLGEVPEGSGADT